MRRRKATRAQGGYAVHPPSTGMTAPCRQSHESARAQEGLEYEGRAYSDIARGAAEQKGDDLCDLLGLADPPQGDL